MLKLLLNYWSIIVSKTKNYLKTWSQPTTTKIITGPLVDLSRCRCDLIAENALLRQQLIVLNRQVKQPKLNTCDRLRMIFLARVTNFWQLALHIVQPETLLRWHRDLFRIYWRRKSKSGKNQNRRIPAETIELIKRMTNENPLWGAEKIRGELLKLGIKLSKRTIQKYMPKVKKNSGQTWSTFIKNHAHETWACDFTVVHSLFFKPIYTFLVMNHETRQIVHTAVTTNPTDEWTAQQIKEATPWGKRPKYLIRDNDSKFGKKFSAVAKSSGIKELKTPFQAPKANALCERLIGSLKRECLDHFLIFNEHQLQRIVVQYADYYNQHRAHQGIKQRIPALFTIPQPTLSNQVKGKVVSIPKLNGLHHSYAYASH